MFKSKMNNNQCCTKIRRQYIIMANPEKTQQIFSFLIALMVFEEFSQWAFSTWYK